MTEKYWYLIEHLGITLDLSLIGVVHWNYYDRSCSKPKLYTLLCLRMAGAVDPDFDGAAGNEWWVHDPDDRKKLQEALRLLGLPTVDLIFEASPDLTKTEGHPT